MQLAAEQHPQARLLMTQPGVGPSTALAYVLTIGDVRRFPRSKQVAIGPAYDLCSPPAAAYRGVLLNS